MSTSGGSTPRGFDGDRRPQRDSTTTPKPSGGSDRARRHPWGYSGTSGSTLGWAQTARTLCPPGFRWSTDGKPETRHDALLARARPHARQGAFTSNMPTVAWPSIGHRGSSRPIRSITPGDGERADRHVPVRLQWNGTHAGHAESRPAWLSPPSGTALLAVTHARVGDCMVARRIGSRTTRFTRPLTMRAALAPMSPN